MLSQSFLVKLLFGDVWSTAPRHTVPVLCVLLYTLQSREGLYKGYESPLKFMIQFPKESVKM